MWNFTQGTGGAATEFRMKCGNTSNTYTKITVIANAAAREMNVKDAISGNATWFCAVFAANQYGESGPSNEVNFVAGVTPSSPTSLVIQAQ